MSDPDIVIVGAGAAGIAAARRITQAGRTVVLLEARDRAGGRAWTDSVSLGVPLDMGSAWLHSADVNPWTSYARDHGFTVDERLPEWGAWIGKTRLPDAARAEWGAAFVRNEALMVEAAQRDLDVAIADLVPQDKYRARFDSVVALLMGSDSARMSSLDYANYADNDINWSVREGLGAVVAHAAGPLDVQLDTTVNSIDSSGSSIRVSTSRGDLRSKAVIVTIPTNLLADRGIRFFPELPVQFVEAISALPLGANMKVFFRMRQGSLPFAEPTNFVRTQDGSRVGSYQAWPSGQEVLLAYFGGDLAADLDQRGETENFARDELASMFGAAFVNDIERSASWSWMQDPWARGSYSYALAGQAHRRAQLSEPLHERVFYAGEACSVHHAGTIHGAWASGVNAAERALDVVGRH